MLKEEPAAQTAGPTNTWELAPSAYSRQFLELGDGHHEAMQRRDGNDGSAVYGPVCTVVWQGPAGDGRPYADY